VKSAEQVSDRRYGGDLLFARFGHGRVVGPAGVVIADLAALLCRDSKSRVDDDPPSRELCSRYNPRAGLETGAATAMLSEGSETGRWRMPVGR
jgi:hypothetical protein